MYRSGREAVAGFGKNLFAAFGYAILPYAFVWGWLTFVHLAPVALLALHAACPSACRPTPPLLAATVALSLVHWTFTYARLRLPVWPALLYPLTFVAFLAWRIRSFVDGVGRRATWKGRPSRGRRRAGSPSIRTCRNGASPRSPRSRSGSRARPRPSRCRCGERAPTTDARRPAPHPHDRA
jgi:hypothetical protein